MMNERIKQLAIEANLISSESNGFDQTRLSIAQQKFAELIIRDCVDIVKWTPSMFPNDAIIKNIKEHFGVEEVSVDQQLRNHSTYFGNNR